MIPVRKFLHYRVVKGSPNYLDKAPRGSPGLPLMRKSGSLVGRVGMTVGRVRFRYAGDKRETGGPLGKLSDVSCGEACN